MKHSHTLKSLPWFLKKKCLHPRYKVKVLLSHCLHSSRTSPSFPFTLLMSLYSIFSLLPAEEDLNCRKRGETAWGPERSETADVYWSIVRQGRRRSLNLSHMLSLENDASNRHHAWQKLRDVSMSSKIPEQLCNKIKAKLKAKTARHFLLVHAFGVFWGSGLKFHWLSIYYSFFPHFFITNCILFSSCFGIEKKRIFRLKYCCLDLKKMSKLKQNAN